MTTKICSKALSRLLRTAALGAGVLLLAGCATGYSFVQPDVAGSGGYYTSPEPYTGQGYYDYYGTGPYYPGTAGWGYYNGTWPDNSIGWFGGLYGGYWSPFFFNLGFSNVWGFPGYWGPWYSINLPIWGCSWDCDYRRHHRRDDDDEHDHEHHHRHGSTSHSWAKSSDRPDRSEFARNRRARGVMPPNPRTRLSIEGFAPAHRLESASFAPHDFVRAPARRPVAAGVGDPRGFARTPIRQPAAPGFNNTHDFARAPTRPSSTTGFREMRMAPAYAPRNGGEPAFVNQRAVPMPARMGEAPRGFSGPVRSAPQGGGRAFSAAPAPRVSAPSSRHDNGSTHTEIR
ncbi:MAG: hypothetical protein ACREP2_00965 [Rhodanobacteraceae bacterium]